MMTERKKQSTNRGFEPGPALFSIVSFFFLLNLTKVFFRLKTDFFVSSRMKRRKYFQFETSSQVFLEKKIIQLKTKKTLTLSELKTTDVVASRTALAANPDFFFSHSFQKTEPNSTQAAQLGNNFYLATVPR